MIHQNILDIIKDKYPDLTKAEKKVADYLFKNKVESQYLTITNLAEEASVADATIFRFCRTLGFSGYNDFKLSLAKSTVPSSLHDELYDVYGRVKADDSLGDVFKKLYNSEVDALTQTMQLMREEDITAAVDILHKAKKVFCFGQGGSLTLAMEAWGRFITASGKFYTVQDNHQQAMTASLLGAEDAILFFSYSGTTRDLMDVLPAAHAAGVGIILVTGFPQSEASHYADVILRCGSREGPLQMGSIAAKVAQMYIIDVLYNDFCRRSMDEATQNIELTTKAIAAKLL